VIQRCPCWLAGGRLSDDELRQRLEGFDGYVGLGFTASDIKASRRFQLLGVGSKSSSSTTLSASHSRLTASIMADDG